MEINVLEVNRDNKQLKKIYETSFLDKVRPESGIAGIKNSMKKADIMTFDEFKEFTNRLKSLETIEDDIPISILKEEILEGKEGDISCNRIPVVTHRRMAILICDSIIHLFQFLCSRNEELKIQVVQ